MSEVKATLGVLGGHRLRWDFRAPGVLPQQSWAQQALITGWQALCFLSAGAPMTWVPSPICARVLLWGAWGQQGY